MIARKKNDFTVQFVFYLKAFVQMFVSLLLYIFLFRSLSIFLLTCI